VTARRHTAVAAVANVLAAAPLAVIYQGWGWLLQSMIATAAMAGAASAARAVRAPLFAQVLAMLAALTAVLTLLFSGGESFAGVIPTGATLEHFGVLLSDLPTDVRENSLPVPDLESLLLVTVAGVGLVALLVDVFAVGLRRPALAGLPMLAVYSVPVAVSFDAVPVLLFAIGAVGYLWLLGTDNVDRVRRFGRRFTGDGRDVDAWEPSPLAAAGRRLAVVGLLVAVVLPLAVPGMTTGLVDRFGPGLGGGGAGTGASGRVNLFAELYGQLNQDETIDLVRVSTDDPDPFYLRLATADQITDNGFQPSGPNGGSVTGTLRGAVAEPGSGVIYHQHQAQVEITEAFKMSLAPIYAELTELSGLDGRWFYDEQQQIVFSGRASASGESYEFTYLRPEYPAEALRQAEPLPPDHPIQERFAQAPLVPEVQALLDQLIDETAAPYDRVRDILAHFSRRNGFRYDLETGPETDAPAIVDFLEEKSGFCVQYATAMAWLVRSAGIPARVTFGFTRGGGGSQPRVLTNRNLHAWTEVYFRGFGWVPFDPTPSAQVTGSADPDWAPDPDAPPGTGSPGGPSGPDTEVSPGPSGAPGEGNQIDDNSGPQGSGPGPDESGPPWWGLGMAVLLVLASLPSLQRLRLRRHRLSRRHAGAVASPPVPGAVMSADATAAVRHRAHLAWDELLDTMLDLRIWPDATETPRATARRLAEHLGTDSTGQKAVRLVARAEEQARYARQPLTTGDLAEAVTAVRHRLAARSGVGRRLRAALLPPSTLQRWRATAASVATWWANAMTRLSELIARLSPRYLLRTVR
jgi:transglutaminase-like putative cysteine protease